MYYASDGTLQVSETKAVTITITDRPIAVDDSYFLPEQGSLSVSATVGVLPNDIGPPGTNLTVQPGDGPRDSNGVPRGSLLLNPDGSFVYTPDPSYSGAVSFTYYAVLNGVSSVLPGVVTLFVSAEVPAFQVKQVAFKSPHPSIISDPDKDLKTVTFDAPYWKDNNLDGKTDGEGERSYPVSFTCGSTLGLDMAAIAVDPAMVAKLKDNKQLKVKGSVQGTEITVSGDPVLMDIDKDGNDDLVIKNVQGSKAFDNKVAVFDPMAITWQVSVDGGTTWKEAGKSSNAVYVTYADPIKGAKASPMYHTLVAVGTKAAAGKDAQADVLSAIWGEFSDRDVRTVGGTRLTYYKSYKATASTAELLLSKSDGGCDAWTRLMLGMLKVQGIRHENSVATIEPKIGNGLLIKGFDFSDKPASFIDKDWPYVNIPKDPSKQGSYIEDTSYAWKYADVTQAAAANQHLPGQGVEKPRQIFQFHMVLKIGDKYYEPSYGLTHENLTAFEGTLLPTSIKCRRKSLRPFWMLILTMTVRSSRPLRSGHF
jgi:hypothetical protein